MNVSFNLTLFSLSLLTRRWMTAGKRRPVLQMDTSAAIRTGFPLASKRWQITSMGRD